MTDILLKCPNCKQHLAATSNDVGQIFDCPECQGAIPITQPTSLFQCPFCSVDLAALTDCIGEFFHCPNCEKPIQVPALVKADPKPQLRLRQEPDFPKTLPCNTCGRLLSEEFWQRQEGQCFGCRDTQSGQQSGLGRLCEFCQMPIATAAVICPHCGQARSDVQNRFHRRQMTAYICGFIGVLVGYWLGTSFDESSGSSIGYWLGPVLGMLIGAFGGMSISDTTQ